MHEQGFPAWILVVEDDPDDRVLLEVALENCSLAPKLTFLSNGTELILYLDELLAGGPPESRLPALILVNSFTPMFDLERLRALLFEKGPQMKIPIVLLFSSRSELEYLKREKRLADAFLIKPVTCDQILDLLKNKNSAG